MKIRKEMSQQDSSKEPVSFHDVAACFSEEEWKLLHQWQMELYENVMNEIHQAVASLGPLVAASVFSLRPNEKEDLFPMDHQDSEIKGSINCFSGDTITKSDMLFGKRESNQSQKDTEDINQRKINCSSTEFPFHNTDIVFRKEQEFEASLMAHHVAEVREICTSPNSAGNVFIKPDVPRIIKEGETYSIDHREAEESECISTTTGPAGVAPVSSFGDTEEGEAYSMDHRDSEAWGGIGSPSDHAVNTSVLSFKIKEEAESYFLNCQDYETRETFSSPTEQEESTPIVSIIIKEDGRTYSMSHQGLDTRGSMDTPTGNGDTKRIRKKNDSAKCTEKVVQYKASTREDKANVFQNSEKATNSRRQLETGRHQELGGEKSISWDSVFRKEILSNAHHGSVESVRSDKYIECESSVRKTKYVTCPQNTPQHGRPYTSAECEQSFCNAEDVIEHQGSCSGLEPKQKTHYQHTEYKKIFSRVKRIGQPRKHFIERPYSCPKCDKRFSQIASRNRHQSTHSEGRAYQCSECEKRFNRKDNLTRHQRSHTRDSTFLIQD